MIDFDKVCKNCNPVCGPRTPESAVASVIDPFRDVLNLNMDVINQLNLDQEIPQLETVSKNQMQEHIVNVYEELFPVDQYNQRDPRLGDTPYNEMPPLLQMLEGLRDFLPISEEQKQQLEDNFDNIVTAAAGVNIAGGGGETTDYTPESLWDILLSLNLTFDLSFEFVFFLFFLIAAMIAGLFLITLFSQLVAGIDIIVNITTEIIIQLLAPLIALCFMVGFSIALLIPLPTIVLGIDISLSLSAVLDCCIFSIFAMFGLNFSLSLRPGAVMIGDDGSFVPSLGGDAKELESATTPPLCEKGILLLQEKPSMAEAIDFHSSSSGKSLLELSQEPSLSETKINVVVLSNPTYTPIVNSVINKDVTYSDSTKPVTLREALNRSRAEEAAVIALFNYLKLPLDTQITLSDLLLKSASMDVKTPIDPIILSLLPISIPYFVNLNTGYVMQLLGKTEPPCPALTLRR